MFAATLQSIPYLKLKEGRVMVTSYIASSEQQRSHCG
jgi:hypothetical protein